MSQFLVYSLADGAYIRTLEVPPEMAARQLRAGEGIIAAAPGVIQSIDIDLDAIRAQFRADIDAAAEVQRARYLTPGSGQMSEYLEASAEAERYQSDTTGDFPMLSADVAAGTIDPRTASPVTTLAAAADLVLFMRGVARDKGAIIREARLGGKRAVTEATNIPEMVAAAAIDWATLLA